MITLCYISHSLSAQHPESKEFFNRFVEIYGYGEVQTSLHEDAHLFEFLTERLETADYNDVEMVKQIVNDYLTELIPATVKLSLFLYDINQT